MVYNKVSDSLIPSRNASTYVSECSLVYVCIDYDIIYHYQRWDVENILSLKNVVVSFQTLKTAIWRSCGTEKTRVPYAYGCTPLDRMSGSATAVRYVFAAPWFEGKEWRLHHYGIWEWIKRSTLATPFESSEWTGRTKEGQIHVAGIPRIRETGLELQQYFLGYIPAHRYLNQWMQRYKIKYDYKRR